MRGEPGAGKWGDEGYWPDVAGEIDRPEEVLAEQLGLSPEQARRVLAWAMHRERVGRDSEHARQMRSICAELMPRKGASVEAVVGGLLAASGLLAGTAFSTMEAIAAAMAQEVTCPSCGKSHVREVSRALLSHWAREWTQRLGIQNFRHVRDEATREKSRAARLRVLAGEKKI